MQKCPHVISFIAYLKDQAIFFFFFFTLRVSNEWREKVWTIFSDLEEWSMKLASCICISSNLDFIPKNDSYGLETKKKTWQKTCWEGNKMSKTWANDGEAEFENDLESVSSMEMESLEGLFQLSSLS